jgi:hypothetical protein
MKLHAKYESDRAAQEQRTELSTKPTRDESVSPAARNLALAHHLDRLIAQKVIVDYTQAARMLQISQPRLSHVMGLLLLAPAIQEGILLGKLTPGDKQLRRLSRLADWEAQVAALTTPVRPAS